MHDTQTVSDLTRAIQQALASQLGQVRVVGEVTQMTAARSGHWYFTLADDRASLNCAMFRGNNQFLRWRPQEGMRVVAVGKVDIYPPAGRYNLVVRRLEQVGEGDRRARLEALKQRLAAEGLFDPARKRPLPPLPRAIGVATSPTGAALHDILRVLAERFPGIPVVLSGCRVQGAEAPAEIVAAMARLVEHAQVDVMVVGRGGGSTEDLAAFDEEAVARAIASCPIPVVSAVGHEVDVSIADLVADVRAATPSHAAELLVPDRDALALTTDELERRLRVGAHASIARHRARLAAIRLVDPRQRVMDQRRIVSDLGDRLGRSARQGLAVQRGRLAGPMARLEALSPTRVLERGYAVVLHEGRAVRDAAQVSTGAAVEVRLHQGRLRAVVQETDPA